ncbi:8-oxoguanine DNA glycosylase OGG fold protein [Falsirhodobacter xinxiangensis]|uniref:8-oxoguanine DNA glycosylase OGG fold protein n=1 Tax=Falsirhodobacter xinxiangensis TaxID=2530049 RepID=UPI0010AB4497|nr:hypothetical protein [Rhodobacter xinxiangensis]
MTFEYHPQHFDVFRSATPGVWPTTSLRDWLGDRNMGAALSDTQLSREKLRELRETATLRERFWLILAWGRINRFHAGAVLRDERIWLAAMERAVDATTRAQAYTAFQAAALATKGMGPAYFTKILFFERPDLSAYIMDQWTARSVNLLLGKSAIQMVNRVSVCKSNGPEVYDHFCDVVDDLASKLDRTGEHVESCLFSTGGRGKAAAPWRQHVRSQTRINPASDSTASPAQR